MLCLLCKVSYLYDLMLNNCANFKKKTLIIKWNFTLKIGFPKQKKTTFVLYNDFDQEFYNS